MSCTVSGCDHTFYAKGLCNMHYLRAWKGKEIGTAENQHKPHFDGLSGHSLYVTWENMIQRCTNPTNNNYPNYGGRGIKVCRRWRRFKNFLADVGEKPLPELTLDRINNDGNYEPSNIRWATRKEQQLNRKRSVHM